MQNKKILKVNMDANYTGFRCSKNDFSNDYEEGNACRM